ncbi:hypothetical protein M7I_2718 [Glarea lozoyensis 74030]|uniref:Uncharacterized protein n=1 Tax=Glarea lozoyensis (strain ATCC 74030 / MF5533) TaxID=1104152 RepID=H0EJJ1_GLAL7|nr:hypothetical protein M7I_2718 [Glarea lozoyensis 74030]
MQLSDSSKATTLPLDPTDKSKTERLALACRSTSKELQQRLSIASDTSDPGLDDPFASSTSDSSSEDHDDDSEGEALEQAAAHLWDSWWSPAKQNLEMRQSFYQVTPRSTMSRPPLQRTRANTTPGNPYAPVHSSGLSIITTLSPTPQGSRQTSWSTTSEDRLYMRSSLNTPPTRPLMDLMSNEICPEISCFEDDDDDEKLGLIDSLGSKLHIRTSCGGAARDKVFDVEEKKRSSKIRSRARSATGAIRDVFVRKRAGTVGCS